MKKATKKQKMSKRSESAWQRLIAKYRRSDLSQSEFCRQESIKLSTFQYWLYRDSDPKGSAELFCELTSKGTEAFEIERNGFLVKVPYNFKPAALKSLLDVMRTA